MIHPLAYFASSLFAGSLLVHSLGGHLPETLQSRSWAFVSIALLVLGAAISGSRDPRHSSEQFRADRSRIGNKCLTLVVGWLLVLVAAAASAALDVAAALIFIEDFLVLLPVLPLLIVAYVLAVERRDGATEDASSTFGAFLRGKQPFVAAAHRPLLLAWLIKAFFIPLMYGNLILALQALLNLGQWPSATNWIAWLFCFGMSADLLVATVGYLCAGKLFRTEVRAVDDYWLSWVACLICYAPFFQYLKLLTAQRDSLVWTDWLSPDQPLYWIWAALIVSSWLMYWISNVSFGIRFSNLSYRGLIDVGPYRLCKHPSYLSKNIYWWLHTVPLYGVLGTADAMINVAGLSLISFIYFLRAKTEERFLRQFPEYAAYAQRIDEKSLRYRLERWYARVAQTR